MQFTKILALAIIHVLSEQFGGKEIITEINFINTAGAF